MKRQEFFEEWIKALESGKYKQTRGVIEEGGRFCCLGVACEVANKTGYARVEIANERECELLPRKLAKKLGLDRMGGFIQPVVYRGYSSSSLVDLNDGACATFKTISKIMRKQLAAGNFKSFVW